MILKITFCTVFACVSWLQGISGASFSNVFVKSGADIVPLEYVNYGAPALPIAGSQIAQISAAPMDSIVSVNSVPAVVTPCVAPCVIPGAPLSMAPLNTANAKIVAYKSPIANVPIVLANKDDSVSYQYAYGVYDESTGDKKTQSEQSNGSVVQGQYSFIQPDGYRREVVYTADDLKGFNAVVRNFLPESDGTKSVKKEDAKNGKDLPPCKDVKSEQLTAPTTEAAPKETTTTLEIEEIEVPTEKPKEVTPTPTSVPATSSSDSNDKPMFSYNDIIGCLQAKAKANNLPSGFSPLTYILIPSLGGFSSLC